MEAERSEAAKPASAGGPKRAAVTLILYERDGEPWLLFTRRTERVADHKGQICFPGGSVDPTDESLLETARRETREELGIDPGGLGIVAALEPVYTVVTNYLIEPYVAYAPRRPEVHPDSFEVAEVIDVPLAALLDPSIQWVERWDSHGVPRDVYFYRYGEHVIWGATARILRQFLDRYTPEWWQAVVRGEVSLGPAAGGPPTPV